MQTTVHATHTSHRAHARKTHTTCTTCAWNAFTYVQGLIIPQRLQGKVHAKRMQHLYNAKFIPIAYVMHTQSIQHAYNTQANLNTICVQHAFKHKWHVYTTHTTCRRLCNTRESHRRSAHSAHTTCKQRANNMQLQCTLNARTNCMQHACKTHATCIQGEYNTRTARSMRTRCRQYSINLSTRSTHDACNMRTRHIRNAQDIQDAFNMHAARKTHKLRATRVQHACKKHTRRMQHAYNMHTVCI